MEYYREFEAFYDSFKPAQENTAESFVWFSGISHPIFNAVMHLTSNANIGDRIDTLISQAPSAAPISFWINTKMESKNLVNALNTRGFHPIMDCPFMVKQVESITLTNHDIWPANSEDFYNILAITFEFDDIVKQDFAKLYENNKEAENYLIYHEGTPIGTGSLIRNGKVGGIFNCSILPEYQRKGYGKAMMHFLMQRAFEQQLETLVLLSSPAAEKMYTDLGFTTCFNIEVFIQLDP